MPEHSILNDVALATQKTLISVKLLTGKVSKSNVTLNLRFLELFKWRDESGVKQQLRIIESVSSKWQKLATLVGLSMSQMDGIKKECLG